MGLVFVVVLAAIILGISLLTRRRFGILVLALTAGLVLTQYMGGFAIDLAAAVGLNVKSAEAQNMVELVVSLLPVTTVWLVGPRYSSEMPAIVASIGFSLFATLMLIKPIFSDLALSDQVHSLISSALTWLDVIVPVVIALALLDVLGTHFSTGLKRSKH